VSIAAVAVGWGAYLNELLDSLLGLSLPDSIANPPGEEGGKVNLPAAILVLAVAGVLMIGGARIRAHQHGDGVLQARRAAAVPRARRHGLQRRQLLAVLRRG
jgi:hypothetical protein